MGDPAVNRDVPASLFLSHLSSYPVVSQGISHFRNTPYGRKSIELADEGYNYARPVLDRLTVLTPYIKRADSLGNEGLNHVDTGFPLVREDPQVLLDYLSAPLRLAGKSKKHVLDVYSAQYNRSGGHGYLAHGKALVTTGLKITSEGLKWLSEYLVPEAQQQPHSHNGQPVEGQSYAETGKK
ncbi:hypothetical protein VTO42DRAFT_2080 [Malbranchea cinnamomea]